MNTTIEQTVKFSNATAKELFEIYTDPEKHGGILGAKVIVSAKEGARFSAFNGNVTGRNLLVVPGKIIVQSWRGNVWKKEDADSILCLSFSDTKSGAQVYMVHAYTPDQFDERWDEFYWKPIKEYLRSR